MGGWRLRVVLGAAIEQGVLGRETSGGTFKLTEVGKGKGGRAENRTEQNSLFAESQALSPRSAQLSFMAALVGGRPSVELAPLHGTQLERPASPHLCLYCSLSLFPFPLSLSFLLPPRLSWAHTGRL